MQKAASRTVGDMGNGCKGVSIPKGLAEEFGIDEGDEVLIDYDLEDGVYHVHLE